MTIDIRLSGRSITSAANQLRKYAKTLDKRTENLVESLAKYGVEFANMYLKHDDTGETRNSIGYKREGNKATVFVSGAAVWIEFGTGVLANAGNTPHPKRDEVGAFAWGEYGQGLGKDIWWFWSNRYQCWKQTAGITMNPFMYDTSQSLRAYLNDLAKEAFKID